MTRKGRIGAAAAAVALALAAAWLWASPYWTLRDMQAAAKAGDAEAVSEHIDYDALRADLKAQITQQIREQAGGIPAEMALALAGNGIDRLVTPDSIREMVGVGAARSGGKDKPAGILQDDEVQIDRTGITTFVAGRTGGDGEVGGAVFTLQGTTWRMTGIRIPKRR